MDKIIGPPIAERDDGVQIKVTTNERYIAIHPDGAHLESRSTMADAIEFADMHWSVPGEGHEPDSYRTPETKRPSSLTRTSSKRSKATPLRTGGASMVKRHRLPLLG